MTFYLYIGLGSLIAGYVIFLVVLYFLPRRLKSDQKREYDEIMEDATFLAEQRRKLEAERLEEDLQLMKEQLDADIREQGEDLKLSEEDLKSRERSLQLEENSLKKAEKDLETFRQKLEAARQSYLNSQNELAELRKSLIHSLETTAGISAVVLTKSLKDKQIEDKYMETQRTIRYLEDDLETSAKRLAARMMARTMSRYAPDFYWPKSINSVEIPDRSLIDRLLAPDLLLINDLKEKAEIEIEILADQDHQTPIIKLTGGAGINREAVRLCLEEVLLKPSHWGKAADCYGKHRQNLEKQAIELGYQAVQEVKLEGIHPEIQKLIGYLNWRTSYRQNQWFHTVEVAKLAGILAHEIGVDPDEAKRVGLLHDIGKAIDYRIEGSHAVISGDYADRFGEKRVICDTVMSHHNDLVLETPLSFVLKTADTLSGARPGARVNLEEGYQMRLSGIEAAVRSFPGVVAVSIMNGAREVHVEVNHKRIHENDLEKLSADIAAKISEDVAFPGEIKILVTRKFEATAVA